MPEPDVGDVAWKVSNSTVLGDFVGVGSRFARWDYPGPMGDHCWEAHFDVPPDSTFLNVTLEEGNPLNTTGKRFGQYAVVVTAPDGDKQSRDHLNHDNRTLLYDSPTPGEWEVRVAGDPVTVNQDWRVVIVLAGVGTPLESLELRPPETCP